MWGTNNTGEHYVVLDDIWYPIYPIVWTATWGQWGGKFKPVPNMLGRFILRLLRINY